jgi:hypothetical protein
MNRALFSVCLLLGIVSVAQAHLQPPITWYVQSSNTVCIAKVTSVNDSEITFTVEEIVKGRPPTFLILRMAEGHREITQNSEWLLASTNSIGRTVGWAMAGDYGWVNAPVQRVDGQIHLVGNYGRVDPSLAVHVSKGLTLEQLKALAKTPLPKN